MFSGRSHGTHKLVTPLGVKGIGLDFVLVHDSLPLEIYPGFSEHTCPQFIILVIFSFLFCDRHKVLRIQGILGFREQSCFFDWKFQSCIKEKLPYPFKLLSKN